MGRHQAIPSEQIPWRASCGRSTCPQWHLLGAEIRRTVARSAGMLWPIHHLLQPFRPLATGGIMTALAGAYDEAVQMIDTSIVRVHQHGACIARNKGQSMGRSRGGGLTGKIHAVVDTNGLPVRGTFSGRSAR